MTFFSENKEEIVKKNLDKISPMLVRKDEFSKIGLGTTYNEAFISAVMSFLTDELVSLRKYNSEEIAIIMDKTFIDIITDGYFFNIKNYLQEANTNE